MYFFRFVVTPFDGVARDGPPPPPPPLDATDVKASLGIAIVAYYELVYKNIHGDSIKSKPNSLCHI